MSRYTNIVTVFSTDICREVNLVATFSSYFCWSVNCMSRVCRFLKDTHREKAPSNKTQAVTKSMNMGIWVVDTSNQLCITGS